MLLRSILFHLPLCVQKFFAERYDLVTAILREVGDMRVRFRDAEPDTQPCVSILLAHESFFPKLIEGPMCLHPFLAKRFICKRSHRQTGRLVRLYISVAGGIPGADVELRCPVFRVDAINAAGRAKLCRRVAVWTGNVGFFQAEILLCTIQKEEERVSASSSLCCLTDTS